MHEQAKLTSKGQITVPKKVRARLEAREGDLISFDEEGGKMVVSKLRIENPFAKYRGILKRGKGVSRDEVVRRVREMRDGE